VSKLFVVTYAWGSKYGPEYVNRLAAGVQRHLKQPHQFVVITDAIPERPLPGLCWLIPDQDRHLLRIPGCFARLRLFDSAYQAMYFVDPSDRVVCLDLDLIVTGPLDPLFDRPEPFVIFAGANASNPCPYNGSVFMLRAGSHPEIWRDFSLDAAAKVPFDSFPDDQAWFAAKLPDAATWRVGGSSGIFAFQKPAWPGGDRLPLSARIVAFPGKRDPSQFTRLQWVRRHWLMQA